ncbi:MAG TPA: Hsp70 family protein [Pseudonocardiaceae bacterium]|nr:Hsp70 family protein [Pseudonocardiaceae bacterium]
MNYGLGIDVGNTFVAAALARGATAEMVNFGDHGVVMPAAVQLRGDGSLSSAGASRGTSRPDWVCGEFMSRLGDPTPVTLGGAPYTVTDLVGTIVRDVIQDVTAAQGGPPDHVMLTHPASWGPFRCVLLEEAARRAGLGKPSMVTEPEAAVTDYAAAQRWNDGDTLAVYDLGGDTFNATVLRQQSGKAHILGKPERIEHRGGNDIDDAILSHVNDTLDGALNKLDPMRPQNIAALAGVRRQCTRAKEALSADTETAFRVLLPDQRFDVRLTRSELDDIARGTIELTIDALSRTVRSAQVEPADLSAILLVGGSSRIPLVARMVSAALGRPAVVATHPQHAAALGAATLAARTTPRTTQRNRSEGPKPQRGDDKRERHAGNGTAIPTLTATKATGTGQPPETGLRIPAQRTASAIPAQRTPPPEETAPAARPALATSAAGADVAPARTPAPVVTPPPAQPPEPPVIRPPGARPAEETSRPPLRRALTSYADRPRVFIGTGLAVTLAGSILLALLGGKSGTPVSGQSAAEPPAGSATTAVAELAPEAAIPAVAATVPLEAGPAFVDVSPNGMYAYIANAGSRSITVLNTADKRVIATIPIATGPPRFLAPSPDGRKLYVSIFNDERTVHAIDVLDTGSNTVIATIPQLARPYLPAISPDGKRLFVPNHDIASVSVIDTASNTVTAQIAVPPNPHWVAFSRDGSRAYTANHESNVVSVIDTATLGVLYTIPVGTSPHAVAVNPRRPLVANVNFDSASVSIIDTTTQKVVATVPVGRNPQDIAWAPDGRFAYTVNNGSGSVSVIDASTNRVTTTIPTGPGPTSIAVLPASNQAYVSDLDGNTLTILDLAH